MKPRRARLLYDALWLADRLGGLLPRSRASAANASLRDFRPGVSVIVPERANPGVLAECLDRLSAARRELSEPSEVIIVVNGAPPSLYRQLMRQHREARWLLSHRPLWYSGAIRRGLRTARYDWVYLLNSDMLLDKLALEATLELRSRRVFAIASQVFFRDPARRREETGWTMFRPSQGPIEILDEVPDDDISVRGTFYAGGGASLFRRYLLQRLARDSSAYEPFYWEDVEWGARAWRMGYESLYCPASRAWHLHRMTNRRFYPDAEIDRSLARNRYIFHFRNGPPVPSFAHFLRTLGGLDEYSLDEVLALRRIALVALGRFQSRRLPSDHIALDRTWEMRYGAVDQFNSEP